MKTDAVFLIVDSAIWIDDPSSLEDFTGTFANFDCSMVFPVLYDLQWDCGKEIQ